MTTPHVTVGIDDRQKAMRVSATTLERLVRKVLALQGVVAAEIGVRLVGDAAMARLNKRWLGHEGPTDVITFPLSNAGETVLVGDIVASTETARRVARSVGWQARHELAYYVIHGLLHLAGYDDRSAADRRRMRDRERRVLRAIGMPSLPKAPGTP
jgi:probable rRNA maturation factor